MGIFDGYLLMSDVDGTFERSKTYPRPQKNVDAINYFTKNGGRFAFATGRLANHLKERGLAELTNAPCCLCNGSYVYDFRTDTVLFARQLPFTVSEFLKYFEPFKVHSRLVSMPDDIANTTSFDLNVCEPPCEFLNKKCSKIVISMYTKENADTLERALSDEPLFKDCYICKSWESGVEISPKGATKGEAIEFIKEYCGAHTSVGIGDYGNDMPLITRADIGVAVGSAVPELKAAADMVVCGCLDDAIADLIYKLEQKIKGIG